jgi:hypothetical protein
MSNQVPQATVRQEDLARLDDFKAQTPNSHA